MNQLVEIARDYFSGYRFPPPAARYSPPERTGRFWAITAGFILIGYLCMGRSFAYLGLKSANVFIGEVVLGLFLLTRTREMLGKWFGSMANEVRLSQLAWIFYLYAGYGAIQVLRGIATGYPFLTALQNLVFNVYPLYIFIGIWVGSHHSNYLGKFFKWFAWCNGIYGILYIVWLNSLTSDGGGQAVALFGQPGGSAVAILGLLCFESKARHLILPLLLNAFVLLGMQVRAEWLGFIIGFVLWGILSKKVGGMLTGASAIAVLLGVGYIADFSIPAPVDRGGVISTRDIIGRGLAAFDPESASKYSENTDAPAGTVEWRTKWWEAIWDSVHETNTRALFGHGYGFPITGLVEYLEGETDIRSPHNIFFFCMAYGGWVGVILFFTFQLVILRLHWLTYRVTKSPFGIGFLAICLFTAFFSNFFETPFGAIPYYLISGLAIAPSLSSQSSAHQTASLEN